MTFYAFHEHILQMEKSWWMNSGSLQRQVNTRSCTHCVTLWSGWYMLIGHNYQLLIQLLDRTMVFPMSKYSWSHDPMCIYDHVPILVELIFVICVYIFYEVHISWSVDICWFELEKEQSPFQWDSVIYTCAIQYCIRFMGKFEAGRPTSAIEEDFGRNWLES